MHFLLVKNPQFYQTHAIESIFFLAVHSLSKCWACSIRNWLPCSHCLSNSWSSVWGIAPLPKEPVLVVLALVLALLLVLLVALKTEENDVGCAPV